MKTYEEIQNIMTWLTEMRSRDVKIPAYIMWQKINQLQWIAKSEKLHI